MFFSNICVNVNTVHHVRNQIQTLFISKSISLFFFLCIALTRFIKMWYWNCERNKPWKRTKQPRYEIFKKRPSYVDEHWKKKVHVDTVAHHSDMKTKMIFSLKIWKNPFTTHFNNIIIHTSILSLKIKENINLLVAFFILFGGR